MGGPFVDAVKPLVDAMGGELLPPARAGEEDVVLSWEGREVVAVRLPQLSDSLDQILAALERKHGRPLAELDRKTKQAVVRSLEAAAPSPSAMAWRRWRAPWGCPASPSTTI